MIYSLQDIVDAVFGALQTPVRKAEIAHLLIDSRRLRAPRQTVFFALVGNRHNGHHYVKDLYDRGVRTFVVQQPVEMPGEEANIILVENTLQALQDLVAHHRMQFHFPVMGITGSNGKTVVKEWLFQLLSPDMSVVRSPKSYNSQVGVPLSIWLFEDRHEFGLVEAGISQPGEMDKLQRVIRPDLGLITNIGEAHSENFNSLEAKTAEKLKLFKHAQTVFYCRDYDSIRVAVEAQNNAGQTPISWSARMDADLRITDIDLAPQGSTITAVWKDKSSSISIPFSDAASIENAIHCWLVLLHLEYDTDTIAARMKQLGSVAMRLEQRAGINGCTLLNDSYNSDLNSLEIALDHLSQQNQHRVKTVILSDILQSGVEEHQLYEAVADMLQRHGVHRFFAVGDALARNSNRFTIDDAHFFESTAKLMEALPALDFSDEAILIKGARQFSFQQVGRALEQQAHGTVLEINLSAMVNNLNYLRSKLAPTTKVMAMVKAFSYGSGSHEVANVLQFHRVDYLGVAYADEGVELRKAGIDLPIMVLTPEPRSFHSIIRHNLEPEIYSFELLEAFTAALRTNLMAEELPFPIHLNFDTGMHRLGFTEADIPRLVDFLKEHQILMVRSVFSHLAASDEVQHDDYTKAQIATFSSMSDALQDGIGEGFLKHMLNSSGVQRFPEGQFDMVRMGIGLYGLGANDAEQQRLEPVSTLKSYVAQVKHIRGGETVGYGRAGKAETDRTIATVSIGYADGLRRTLSNGVGKMVVNGQLVPIIGNVCMDMTMLDVTGVPVSEGDEVTVFGEGYPLQQLSEDMDTIPYEVLTSISRRVKRVYYQE